MRAFQCDLRFIERLAYCPAGRQLHAFGTRRTRKYRDILAGRIFDLGKSSTEARPYYDYPQGEWVAISDDGQWRAIGYMAVGQSRIIIRRSGEDPRHHARRQPANIQSLEAFAFAPSEPILAIGFTNSNIQGRHARIQHGVCLWDVEQSRERWRFALKDRPGEVLFSPDGRHIAIAQQRGHQIRLMDYAERASVGELACQNHLRLAFGPSGKFLAAAGNSVIVWTLENRERVAVLPGQDEDVPGLAFSPDERILAVARSDGPVEFWDVESGQLRRSFNWNIGRLSAIAFAPDGLTCAVAGGEGRIVVWDVGMD